MIVFIMVTISLLPSQCNNRAYCVQPPKFFTDTISGLDSTYSIQYKQGYSLGVQEAINEMEKDSMTFYECGEEPDYPYNIETGLPAKIISGCIINDSIAGIIAGHNQAIKNHLKSIIRDDEIRQATAHLDSTTSNEFRQAYYQGMQEAYAEIKNNKITRYVYGLGHWGDVDKETGIPIKIIAGCVVSDSILGRADGHNYIILRYLNGEIK